VQGLDRTVKGDAALAAAFNVDLFQVFFGGLAAQRLFHMLFEASQILQVGVDLVLYLAAQDDFAVPLNYTLESFATQRLQRDDEVGVAAVHKVRDGHHGIGGEEDAILADIGHDRVRAVAGGMPQLDRLVAQVDGQCAGLEDH